MLNINNGIIRLSGRVDSGNAGAIEQELFALYTGGAATIDVSELEYISSAGLRVLLKLRKRAPEVTLLNVSLEVYEILEMTGFTEMLNVKRAMRFVSVEGLKLLGQGGHGKVYKLSDDMIIKTYYDESTLEDIERERQYGRNAFVNGVPCAIGFDVVKCEDGYGVIFEMAGAQTLSSYVEAHPEKLPEYAVKYAELLKALNACPADKALYGSIREIYVERLRAAGEYFTDEENAALMKLLDAIPEADTMIHGDYHPNNVMVDGEGELLLIDMADISYGNPLFDIGGTCLLMMLMGQNNHALVKETIGMEYEYSVQMWNILLSQYYEATDPQRLGLLTHRCVAFALLRMAASLGMRTEGSVRMASGMVAMLRGKFFPNASSLPSSLPWRFEDT